MSIDRIGNYDQKINNINKANKLITSCPKNLYFDLRPLEFLL